MTAFGATMLLLGAIAAKAQEPAAQNHPDLALQQKLDLLDHGQDTQATPPAPLVPDVNKGSFPHSWLIPGTNTSVRVYGQGTETLQYSR